MSLLQAGDSVPLEEKSIFIGRVGDEVPEGESGCAIGGRFEETSAEEIFKGRRVLVFALPGAFTPTCSSKQLPGFEAAYDEFKSHGIDEVYCLSVNDGFVMNAWFKQEGIKKVKPLCDGNNYFTSYMGATVAKYNLGFGLRSWRYAMIVDDGVIEWIKGEGPQVDNSEADPYGRSSPESVLTYLNGVASRKE